MFAQVQVLLGVRDGICGVTEEERIIRAAGILEGEGSFLTRTGKKYPRVSCSMTDLDVLEELLDLFGGAIYPVRKQAQHHKQSWRWGVEGHASADLMERVKGYMFTRRREKIDLVLREWYEHLEVKAAEKSDRNERMTQALEAYGSNLITMKMAGELYGFSWLTVQKELNKVRLDLS